MTEALLVTLPLLIIVFLAPFAAHVYLDLQFARTEAHRDMFDKTTSMLIMPDALMDNSVNDAMGPQFGQLTPASRQHAFASFPPDVPDSVNNIFDPPGGLSIKFTPTVSLDLFDDGFPNYPVEGWEYIQRRGLLETSDDLFFMTYGATIRSPWTWLGYPVVATQDLIFEPKQMQDWQGEQEFVDDDARTALKMAE